MKYFFFLWLIAYGFCPIILSAQPVFDAKQKSLETLSKFKAGQFHEVYIYMEETMKREIDEEQLQAIWDGLQMQFDTILNIEEPTLHEKDSFLVTITPVQFKSLKLGIQFTFNTKGQICGFFIVPVNMPYQPAAYLNTNVFYEIKKNIPNKKYPSEGILTMPDGNKKVPLIIIVGGSGPTDKDLTMGPNKIYKDLAWGLASKGIGVYRYDKRTVKFGVKMSKDKKLTVKQEYLDDLKSIVKMLSKMAYVDPTQIYIMGHSEGGSLIPYFAKNLKGIRGFISLAGSYSLLAELIPNQVNYLADHAKTPKEKEEILKMMPKAIYARDRFNRKSPNDSLPLGITTPYLWHLNENSPEKLISTIENHPSLFFLQGGRDYQVPPAELEKWKMALAKNTTVVYKVYKDLNHLFLTGKGDSVPSEYLKTGNVPEVVINDISNWVLKK